MRAAPLLILLSLAASPVLAQNTTPAPAASTAPADAGSAQPAPDTGRPESRDRTNQRVEHIHVEDGGSRVDELRVGGQTRSITVQPKVGDMPSYEVQSNDGARASRNRGDGDGTNGTRVWNLKKF
ncbi:Protein of uncharacterised function (DUF2782) [Delftia tsuruhatensis]|uniref:hypothetical protein n=1 Tax=Delftia tsuruhatensis TaxID=180282 RepID=UPI001E6BB6BA|nr:hypothetical protein [Delftia tsuruhatensis]CAB5696551.1 Protein of uncharacterised function (DUF2782) [Delftia tsuruhatensis]CAC9678482.1 Protein of uncharacterised function (DUF2782) [Delftia tsuruhatensis]